MINPLSVFFFYSVYLFDRKQNLGKDRRRSRNVPKAFLDVLDFATVLADGHAHHGENVVRCRVVIVDAAVERHGGVFADLTLEQCSTAWMRIDELADVVDEPGDENQRSAVVLPCELLVFFERDHRQVGVVLRPGDAVAQIVQGLASHGVPALLDLVLRELLQAVRQAEDFEHRDEMFRRIVLEPFESVAIVRRELVVKVVVAFAESDESGDVVIARRVTIVERRVAQVVSQGVDAERRVMEKKETKDAGEEVTTTIVAPAQAADERGNDEGHDERETEIVTVLPLDCLVVGEIGDVGGTGFAARFEEQPADVRVEDTLVSTVRIKVSVGIAMMGSMTSCPPLC